MSKRPSSGSSSPQKNKKAKNTGQTQLESFFKSPRRPVESPKKALPEFIVGSSKSPTKVQLTQSQDVIDVDALDEIIERPIKPTSVLSTFTEIDTIKNIKLNGKSQTSAPMTPPITAGLSAIATTALDFRPLDVNYLLYDANCQPKSSGKAPYGLLTHALISLSQTKSRITILNTLTNVLRSIILDYPSSLRPAVYLLSNSLGPQFVPIELGLGSSIISHSIQEISGLTPAALKKLYNTSGDPGDVAFAAKSNLRTLIPHAKLTIPYVYESLRKIAQCRGKGAAKEKQKIVEKLLLAASGEEVRYLTRTLCQNLRVGAVRTSILTALARAVILTPPQGVKTLSITLGNEQFTIENAISAWRKDSQPSKEGAREIERVIALLCQNAESALKKVYAKHPNFDNIVPSLLQGGTDGLAERVPLTVGVPVLPMLGSPTRSLDEIYARLAELPFTAEFKYDGQRAQIHAFINEAGQAVVKLFSRHLEDMTSKYPDIIALVKLILADRSITSFIMDAEVVAIDPQTDALKTFQELSNRPRKDVKLEDIRIPVCVFAFDLMYLDGESLLERSFRERRALLRTRFTRLKPNPDHPLIAGFDFVRSCESVDGKTIVEEFLMEAIENRCEGLMVKLLDRAPVEVSGSTKSRMKSLPCTYEPDIRTSAWLKLKKDYVEGIGDSLDLIPVGAWYGNGRKAQWWSPVLLALWDPEAGRPVALCKCMSGFTDSFYKSMRQKYDIDSETSDECSKRPLWNVEFGGYQPDVYFRPHEVWESRGADITESPVSVAAKGIISSRGLSLRFPRFIRVRDDKGIEQANTPLFLADLCRSQQGKKKVVGNDDGDLIDAEGFGESDDGLESEEGDESGKSDVLIQT